MTGQTTFENPVTPSGGPEAPTAPATETQGGRPEHIPEKFWDAEKGTVRVDDLVKSYSELEGKFRAGEHKQEATEEAPKDAPKDGLEVPKDADPEKAVEQAGLDMDALAQEYTENGNTLTDETLAKLSETDYVQAMAKAMGVEAKDLITDYIAGQQALSQSFEADIKSSVGGADEYNAMVQWAAQGGLDQAGIDAFNAAVAGDAHTAKLAVQGLHAQYKSANPTSDPKTNVKTAAAPAQTGGFKSLNDMMKAQADPRYGKTDHAGREYMAEFERRLALSTF